MKRVVCLLLVLVMCLGMCACGKSEAVKNVEALIAEISEDPLQSREAVEAAAEAWALLTDVEEAAVEHACSRCALLRMEKQQRGYLLRIQGKAAHASTPEKGENAICRLLNVLCEEKL